MRAARLNRKFQAGWLILSLLAFPLWLCGQADTLLPDRSRELLEDIFLNAGGETGDFDFIDQFESLQRYISRPLNLNRASEEDLRELGLLSDLQILNLIAYRNLAGPLIALYELQAVPGFDLNSIQRVLPYVTLEGGLDDFQVGLAEMVRQGRNEAQLRWSRFLELQEGFRLNDPERRFLGDPNQYFFRYRHTYYNRLSWGIVGEKDRGEEFFRGSNPGGFSFYSAHFFLNRYNNWLKALALGDYRLSIGQGLILFSGFGYGKSGLSTTIKRSAQPLRASASASETGFQRGAAATLAITPHLSLTPFISIRRRDGSALLPDSVERIEAPDFIGFTSLNNTGFHRTAAEIARRGNIRHTISGASLKYQVKGLQLGLNGLLNTLEPAFSPTPQPYNLFFFRGNRLFNASADYAFTWSNLHLFGETAWSANGALATINGLLFTPDRSADIALLFRHFPRNYQALDAAPFADGTGARNETGFYFGAELRPAKGFTLNAYADIWEHPWMRFRADSPSRGQEYRLRITYEIRRKIRAFAEIRSRHLEQNARVENQAFNMLAPEKNLQCRMHLSHEVSKSLELRSRIDWASTETMGAGRQTGYMLLQDVIFQPLQSPLSFTARYALFDTPGYAVRFYHFENDLLNAFSIPPYYNRGSRFYVNLRYRPVRDLTLELRFAQTYWANQDQIGSGLDATAGPQRTQISSQIKVVF